MGMDWKDDQCKFDCMAATTLFWDVLPVERRRSDRDHVSEQLSFRMLHGSSGQGHGMKVIRMYLFSELNVHELYTLDISEEDFQSLKSDQGILVDFSKFADKVVDLLEKCIDAKCQSDPRFRAVLDCCDGEGVFKLLETNDFKQIPHISLAFRRGDSHAVHCFLKLRTSELQIECDSLSERLAQRDKELKEARESVSEYSGKLHVMERLHNEAQMKFDIQIKELQSNTHCELVKQREDLIFAHERDIERLSGQHTKEIQQLQTKLTNAEFEANKLREESSSLCNDRLLLQHASCEHERCIERLSTQATALQAQLEERGWAQQSCEDELKSAQSMLGASQNKIHDLQGMLSKQVQHSQLVENALKKSEETVWELSDARQKHDIRMSELAEEVLAGNDIVDQVTEELSLLQLKLKRKQSRLHSQEQKLSRMMAEVEMASREANDSAKQLQELREQSKKVYQEHSEMTLKLKECKGQLEANEKLIRWLNSQVNQVHMRATIRDGTLTA